MIKHHLIPCEKNEIVKTIDELVKLQLDYFWTEAEINLGKDISAISDLSPAEKHAVITTLKLFTITGDKKVYVT